MKIIDGKGAVLGRLGSYVAKEALKGEEIVILNCDQVIITGNKKNIEAEFFEKRQKGAVKATNIQNRIICFYINHFLHN